MSLLTNEQIAELACIASNQSTSRDLHDELHEWNEKQTKMDELCGFLQCYEPEWVDLHKNVKRMNIKVNFYGDNENILETLIVTHHRPEPVITPHPHAAIIAKYAEVAQRRVDPWVEFEWYHIDKWRPLTSWPTWGIDVQYRHIGETK
jgi:hypothetical protein